MLVSVVSAPAVEPSPKATELPLSAAMVASLEATVPSPTTDSLRVEFSIWVSRSPWLKAMSPSPPSTMVPSPSTALSAATLVASPSPKLAAPTWSRR